MKAVIAVTLFIGVMAFKSKVDNQPLLSPITYEGRRFSEILVENTSSHVVRIDYYTSPFRSASGSFTVAAGKRVPLWTYERHETDSPIDSPALFFRTRTIDSFVVVFEERHRVAHYPDSRPPNPSSKSLQPGASRNLGWIRSWDYRNYLDPTNGRLIDGFRYQITDADYQYAIQ